MTPYEEIGGEAGVKALVDRFYAWMDELEDTQHLRKMHPQNLATSREKLFWFLSGRLGGPQLFVERRGHPRLRARHLPFAIDEQARDQWMLCMRKAMAENTSLSTETREKLDEALWRLADHMRNTTAPGLKLVE